jgi:hypothetical protein
MDNTLSLQMMHLRAATAFILEIKHGPKLLMKLQLAQPIPIPR